MVHQQMDKQNVLYTYNKMRYKMKILRYNIDEPQAHCIIPSELSQSPKVYAVPIVVKCIETESSVVVAGGCHEGE